MADDRLAAVLLEGDEGRVEPTDLVQGIRKMCVSCAAVPVVCGSALRGVAIQPLMDSIVAYLPTASELPLEMWVLVFCFSTPPHPSPSLITPPIPLPLSSLPPSLSLSHHSPITLSHPSPSLSDQLWLIAYVHMHSSKCMMFIVGCWCTLESSQALSSPTPPSTMPLATAGTYPAAITSVLELYCDTCHCREKVTRLLSAQADQLQEVKTVHKGSIAVAVGLKHVSI